MTGEEQSIETPVWKIAGGLFTITTLVYIYAKQRIIINNANERATLLIAI